MGVVIAFAAHGFFYPIRMVGKRNGRWAYGLLKKAFADALERGYPFYVTHLDINEIGMKLARLMRRRGGQIHAGNWIGGAIATLLRCEPAQVKQERQIG